MTEPTHVLQARFKRDEEAIVKDIAEKKGLSISQVIRRSPEAFAAFFELEALILAGNPYEKAIRILKERHPRLRSGL